MQFLRFPSDTKLVDLADLVGDRNVDYILATNGLSRSVNVGAQLDQLCDEAAENNPDVTPQQKKTVLNRFTEDSDVFETAALLSEVDWRVLYALNTFREYLYIPETIPLPSSSNILGNNEPIGNVIYNKAMNMLSNDPYIIDPIIFNEYSTIKSSQFVNDINRGGNQSYWFPIPLGRVSLYSSLSGQSIDIPAYPEELDDSTSANYTQMPDMLYQYEPWNVYQSSGPRNNTYTWSLHRDMWSGNHHDGRANELLRFCKSCCYPEYSGAAVYSDIITLYVNGYNLITGIMTDWKVKWEGPLLDDSWYGAFTLEITITEVSKYALNNTNVKNQPLIG